MPQYAIERYYRSHKLDESSSDGLNLDTTELALLESILIASKHGEKNGGQKRERLRQLADLSMRLSINSGRF